MIVGLGVDLVEIGRVRQLHARFGDRFARRLLAPEEWREYARATDPARVLAKRFAVKEAAAKALGTGIARGVAFPDILTTHREHGAPVLEFRARAAAIARELGVARPLVTLSDERDHVVALVVLEGRSG